jgi:hypothetical protein
MEGALDFDGHLRATRGQGITPGRDRGALGPAGESPGVERQVGSERQPGHHSLTLGAVRGGRHPQPWGNLS